MARAYIAGVGVTQFALQPDTTTEQLGLLALREALRDAGIQANQVGALFAGTVYSGPALGQRIIREWGGGGMPVVNVENACASASTALLEASLWVKAGMCDVAVAVGAESLSRVAPGTMAWDPSDILATSGVTFAGMYGLVARDYMERYGYGDDPYVAVAVKNREHGRHNPYALYQSPLTADEVRRSRPIAEPLTRWECCSNADGAAAAVVVSERMRSRLGGRMVQVAGSGIRSGKVQDKLAPGGGVPDLARSVFAEAGLGPEDVDVAEVHDAFASAEVLLYESLGFCAEGEGGRYVMSGRSRLGGDGVVTNPSGGLLSRGHPPGATGLAQVAELVWQLRGQAGARQVEAACVALAHNQGGNQLALEFNAAVVHLLTL